MPGNAHPPDAWQVGGVQVEKRINISTLITVLLLVVAGITGWVQIKRDVQEVAEDVTAVRETQAAGVERAEKRQEDLQERINEVVTVSRDRNAALDARIRPLEAQAAATTATLQAINNSLIQLGADVRDLRKSLEEKPRR